MSPKRPPSLLPLLLAMLATLSLAACGGASATAAPTFAPAAAAPTIAPAAPAAAATAGPAGGGAPSVQSTPAPGAVVAHDPSRKIIKDATLTLEVANIDLAIGRISGIAAQVGGYILETRTDNQQADQKQALVRLAVPVDQFEVTLQRLREGANRIINEQASGVDVTQEFVDVQSQLANLEATQARIREFLKQAATVEEALKVNAQLTEIEGQINVLKGRMNFLSQRAAYSTISVQLQQIPPPTPTPSPTLTPTPTPTPEPIWNPGKTTQQATATLSTIVQVIGTLVIWLAIVVLPLAVPLVLLALLVRYWVRRRAAQALTHAAPKAGD